MRAIFKPDDPTKLIIRDADTNEVSLIKYFMSIISNGGELLADTRFDLNDNPAGILFTAKPNDCHVDPDDPVYSIYVPVEFEESRLGRTYTIKYSVDEGYEIINLDIPQFELLKRSLAPNCINASISFDNNTFEIQMKFDEDYKEEAISYQVPEGLLNLRDIETGKENFYSGTFTISYAGQTVYPGESGCPGGESGHPGESL